MKKIERIIPPANVDIKDFKPFGKEIPDIYEVKFRPRGDADEYYYGVAEQYEDMALKLWKKGILMVKDSILPIYYELTPDKYEIVPVDICGNEYDKYIDKELALAIKASDKAKGLVGKMFSCGVGDGSAFYVVVGETKTKADIEWRGFSLDRWESPVFGMGGRFDKKLIQKEVGRRDRLRAIFA